MTWFKVDDTLGSHPKARAAGLAAMGLWVVAGAWSSQHLTEGFVPDWFINSWPSGQKRAANLVQSGLWIEADSGFRFHQWEERNPSKEQVESERAAARERQRKHRESKRDAGVSHGVTNGVTNRTPSRPDPTVVPGGTTSEGARKRATRLPGDWAISQDLCDWAVDQGYSPPFVMTENAKFIDYWNGIPGQKGTKLDWPGTWRNWIRRAAENHRPKTGRSTPDPVGRLERTLQRVAERQNTPKELPQ